MIKSDGHIRLIDYGLGRILAHPDERCRTICGTPAYLAPEVCLTFVEKKQRNRCFCCVQIRMLDGNATNDGYSYSVDYWTLGIVFGEMLAGGQDEFDVQLTRNNHGQFDPQLIVSAVTGLPLAVSAPARACLSGLLELDPDKRLGMPHSPYGQIREHRFFTEGSTVKWDEIDAGTWKPLRRRSSVRKETDR
jgi:serine/threonine protein kinase